jgi:hypothetical protein
VLWLVALTCLPEVLLTLLGSIIERQWLGAA